jgi:CBS domain-containing protein
MGDPMKHRKVTNLMAGDVISVSPGTPFKEVARLLDEHGLSGMPVVDAEHRVLGVVSTTDLLLKESRPQPPGVVARLFRFGGRQRAKAAARVAADLMTAPAVTVGVDADVVDAARSMEQHKITRLPVVDGDGRLVGIVGRGDLLRVFLRPDDDIAAEVMHEVFEHELGAPIAPATVSVKVRDGVLTLRGELEYRSQVPATIALARRVDGVVAVVSEVTWQVDDRQSTPADPDTTEAVSTFRRNIR